jgi:hypothetical protein
MGFNEGVWIGIAWPPKYVEEKKNLEGLEKDFVRRNICLVQAVWN